MAQTFAERDLTNHQRNFSLTIEILFYSHCNLKIMRRIFVVFMLVATVACSQKKGKPSDSDLFGEREKLAEVTNKKLDEMSGLAASEKNKDLLWTINDSGNRAEIYLLDKELNIKMTCKLGNVINRDWEDIAVGPGPEAGKIYLYVAEIGDNMAIFPYKHVYRFEEPHFTGNAEVTITKFDTITFKLDVTKDTESLMINPKTKNLYVISKREEPVYVYELKYPYSTTDTLTAQKIASIPYSMVVGADFSADGTELLAKNYRNVLYWKIDSDDVASALKKAPAILKYTEEPQGESITFSRDGSGYYTVSEKVKGEKSFLYFYPRAH